MVRISVPNRCSDEGSKEVSEKQELEAKAFIFDKDGTLLTHNHFVPIMEKRLELLIERYQLSDQDKETLSRLLGLDPSTHEIIYYGTMFIARADTQLLIEAFLGEKGYRGLKIHEHVDKIFQDADAQVNLEKYLHISPVTFSGSPFNCAFFITKPVVFTVFYFYGLYR